MSYKSYPRSRSPSPYPQPGADLSSVRLAILKRRVPHLFGSRRHSRRSKRLAMSTPRSPSSLSNPASAVVPVDTDTIWNIHRRLSQLRKARNTDDFPPLLDIELLVGLAEAFLNAPSDSSLKSRFWAELLPKVDAALTKAFERSRSLLSPGASDEFVKIPTDIKGWIEEVVPIHVELIKDIVQQGRGKEAVLELLPVLQELKNVKDIPPENQDTLSDLVLALDRLLKSESQELSGDDYVIPPEENFMRILGVNNSDELRQLCEASGIFEYSMFARRSELSNIVSY